MAKMMSANSRPFSVGEYVVAVSETLGWGNVQPGMVGVIKRVVPMPSYMFGTGPAYIVKFVAQDNWTCGHKDLQKALPAAVAMEKAKLVAPSQTLTVPTDKIKDIERLIKQMGPLQPSITYDALGSAHFAAAKTPAKPKPRANRMPAHLKGVKVGSMVQVLKDDNDFKIGDVVKVESIDHDDKTIRLYNKRNGASYWFEFDDVSADISGLGGKVSFESVILSDEKKSKIMATIKQVDNHNLIFKVWGFDQTLEKGKAISMLFYGPPGTGKTLAAQAIADHLDKELKMIASAEIESSEPGQAERNIKAFFEGTKENTVLLFDECDSLVYSREHVGSILAAQVNQLLSSLEAFKGIVIFTTNRLGVLDEAFNRRLSLKLEFGMPSVEERVKIWQRMFPKKAPLSDDVDWQALAEVELSGGYIKNVVLRAARVAAAQDIKDKDKKITMKHLIDALTDEVESVIEFDEARANNHLPKLRGGGGTSVSRGVTRTASMGTN